VDPDWDGNYIERQPDHARLEPGRFEEAGRDRARRMMAAAAVTLGSIELATEEASSPAPETSSAQPVVTGDGELAAVIIEQTREPLSAMALLLSLLWQDNDAQAAQQAALIEANIRGLPDLVAQFGRELAEMPRPLKLPLMELCLPTLKQISPGQYETFKQLLLQMIKADGRIALEEWCLYQLVRHYLDPEFVQVTPSRPKHKTLGTVADSLCTVLGTLALQCDANPEQAFKRGVEVLELPLIMPPVAQLGVGDFSQAVKVLADCYPLLKVTILKALATTAAHDGVVNPDELMLIRAIAAMIDCPVPDHMLPGVKTDASEGN
jgi:hypothetical protein